MEDTVSKMAILSPLLKRASFTAREVRAVGVSPSLVAYYVKKGWLMKLDRGLYCCPNYIGQERVPFQYEDLIATVRSIPNGIVCLISALHIHNLTEEILRETWIAIPSNQYAPRRKKTRIIRVRDTQTGLTSIKLDDVIVNIFDRERAVIDAFKFLDIEIAIKALKLYLAGNNFENKNIARPDFNKLAKYATILRVNITPYIDALTI